MVYTKNLKRLSLKGCTRLSTKALRDIPRNLQSLQDLDLSGCRACTDDLLHKLKEWCPDLLILKLESCTQVTDQGLEFLLGKAQPGCRKLLEVNVSSTSITDEGVALLMISLSDLWSLSSAGITSSTGSSIAIPIPDCTKLNCLNLSYSSITDSNVKVITDKCPGLVDLSLACCGSLSAVCLHHITSLKHLRKLNIASMKANFLADFVPFLKASGSRLEILDISGMKGVDSKFFGLHCCLLQELMLTDCEDITGSFIKQTESGPLLSLTQACCSLRLLSLQGCSFSTSKPLKDHLSAILTNSSNLQFLDLSSNRDLEDEAIAHFVSSSKLGGLRGLNLAHCLHITFEAMKPVVEKCRNLALLDLSHCRNISLREVESLKKTAGKRLGILWV